MRDVIAGDLGAEHDLWQHQRLRGADFPGVAALVVARIRCILAVVLTNVPAGVEVALPGSQVRAQPFEIDAGKRVVCAVQVAQGSVQDRARSNMIARRLMMESYRQLNHALKMHSQNVVARHGVPNVLENFVSVEKMGAIEQAEAFLEMFV